VVGGGGGGLVGALTPEGGPASGWGGGGVGVGTDTDLGEAEGLGGLVGVGGGDRDLEHVPAAAAVTGADRSARPPRDPPPGRGIRNHRRRGFEGIVGVMRNDSLVAN